MPVIKDPALRERNTQAFMGCSEAEALRLNGGEPLRTWGSPAQRYLYQRQSSFKRGIGWEITFPEWLGLWADSGKWDLRGVGLGHYCMARNGDEGPYRVGNVSIQLSQENSRDGIKKTHASLALSGNGGSGWSSRVRHGAQIYSREPLNTTQQTRGAL